MSDRELITELLGVVRMALVVQEGLEVGIHPQDMSPQQYRAILSRAIANAEGRA